MGVVWDDLGFVPVGLIDHRFAVALSWPALLGPVIIGQGCGVFILRHERVVLRRVNSKPRLSWTDRVVLACTGREFCRCR